MLEDDITIYFLIDGHKKNRCHGEFGHIKREMKRRNVMKPKRMVEAVRDSSEANFVVNSADVRWNSWNSFVETFYIKPKGFRITQYHVLKFTETDKTCVKVKNKSHGEQWESVRFLNRNVSPYTVCLKNAENIGKSGLNMGWKTLNEILCAHKDKRRDYI